VKDEVFGQGRLRWMPKVRGSDRLGDWLRKKMPYLAFWRYRSDLAMLPIVTPAAEYHRVMRKLPARIKIGICGNEMTEIAEHIIDSRNWYSANFDTSELPWNYPEMDATRKFLEFLGITISREEVWPEVWTAPEDVAWAEKNISHGEDELILGIAPGVSSNSGKNLQAPWYSEVLSTLEAKKVAVILIGSELDRPVCDELEKRLILSGVVRSVTNLCGSTTICQSIECMRRCDLLLCQETAAVHIATTLRKPVVGIVGGGHFGRFYPWGDPKTSRAINKPMDCYGCNWICKYETMRCIQEIPPHEASAALNELIDTCLLDRL
jgi:ADP-heptose:LPS heptosyltransferase